MTRERIDWRKVTARAEALGMDVQVWRPDGHRRFSFTHKALGPAPVYCRDAREAKAFVDGLDAGVKLMGLAMTGGSNE